MTASTQATRSSLSGPLWTRSPTWTTTRSSGQENRSRSTWTPRPRRAASVGESQPLASPRTAMRMGSVSFAYSAAPRVTSRCDRIGGTASMSAPVGIGEPAPDAFQAGDGEGGGGAFGPDGAASADLERRFGFAWLLGEEEVGGSAPAGAPADPGARGGPLVPGVMGEGLLDG